MKKIILLLVLCLIATVSISAQSKVYSTFGGDKSLNEFHKIKEKTFVPHNRAFKDGFTLETALQSIIKQEKDKGMTPLFTHRAEEGDVVIRITYIPKLGVTNINVLYLTKENKVGWIQYDGLNGYSGDRLASKKSIYKFVVQYGNVYISKKHSSGELRLIMMCQFISEVDKDGSNVVLVKSETSRTAEALWKKEY